MSEVATLPTRRDEAWRYSNTDALAALAPGCLDNWRSLAVPAGERVQETIIVDSGEGVELQRIAVEIAEDAHCAIFAVVCGGDPGRLEINVTLAKGAHFELGGVTLGGGVATHEIVTQVTHAHPRARSNQVVRSVHWGQSTGNFLGTIAVARDAQHSDAAQSFKGLLLARGASVNTVPQLEIFADDVKCAHGAAVGQLDQQAAFYMAARGLPPEVVRRLLVQAFIGDAFVALDDAEERERLMALALGRLEGEV